MAISLLTMVGCGGVDDSGDKLQDGGCVGMVHNLDKCVYMLEPYLMAIRRYLIYRCRHKYGVAFDIFFLMKIYILKSSIN